MKYDFILNNADNKDFIDSLTEAETRELIHHFLFNIMKFKDDEDILTNITYKDFVDHNLIRLLKLNNSSAYEVLNKYYKKIPKYRYTLPTKGKWDDEAIKSKVYEIVMKHRWFKDEDLLNNFSRSLLIDEGCRSMLYRCKEGEVEYLSLYDVLDMAFPNRFNRLQLKHKKHNFWDDKGNLLCAVFDICSKEKLSVENLREELRIKHFELNGYKSLYNHYNSKAKILDIFFDVSPIKEGELENVNGW